MTAQWADPPPIGGPQDPRAVWIERLRPLVQNPGRWALLASGLPSTMNTKATTLRMRQVYVPPGEWEFTVRTFRRGVHVGDMNVAQLYGRFLGPDADGTIISPERVAGRPGMPYRQFMVHDAPMDDDGRRLCEECGVAVLPPPVRGSWTRKCDPCTATTNPKWYRRRERFRANGYPQARKYDDPGEPGSVERIRAVMGEERFQEMYGVVNGSDAGASSVNADESGVEV